MANLRQCIMVVLTLATVLVFAAAVVFFYFGQYADQSPVDFYFYNKTLEVLERYPLEITPSGWTFWTWAPIFGWQVLWLFYSLILLCRRHAPQVFTPFFFVFNLLAYGFTLGWVMLWAREMINYALGFMAGTMICLYIALALVYNRFSVLLKGMKKFPACDHCMIEVLVINGIALYASWATFTTFQGVGIVGKYTAGVRDHVMSTIVLTGFSAVIIFWFCLDNFVFWRSTLHTVTVYPALVVGFAGTFHRFWDKEERNSLFNVALLGASGLMCILKVVHIICRACWDSKKRRRHVLSEEEKFEL